MLAVFAISVLYLLLLWVVFGKLKLFRLTPIWGLISGFFLLHLLFVPLVGMRFVAPFSADVLVYRHTIQLVPRLPEPTLVEQVLVREGQSVKKGDPLFVFDQRLYTYEVEAARASLAAAEQNVAVLKADVDLAGESVKRAEAELAYRKIEASRFANLASQRAAPQEQAQRWAAEVAEGEAAVAEARAKVARAEAAYASQIGGVNTAVVEAKAQLAQAEYFEEQTVMHAPEDGMIVNLQVQKGMVSGVIRAGAIASFIVERDPYLLAMYRQESLKFVAAGQEAVVALNLYPGQHFRARVEDIWWASGRGQLLPSGQLPVFPDAAAYPEARMPVQLVLEDADIRLPIGAEGAAVILTNEQSQFTWVGQIALRTYTWSRWLYPLPF